MTRSRRPSAQTTAVVLALAEDPTAWRYGYQLCQQLNIKPGSLYPPYLGAAAAVVFAAWSLVSHRLEVTTEPPLPLMLLLAAVLVFTPFAAFFVPAFAAGPGRRVASLGPAGRRLDGDRHDAAHLRPSGCPRRCAVTRSTAEPSTANSWPPSA